MRKQSQTHNRGNIMQTAKKEEVNHAEQNAKAWAESIAEMVAALEVDYERLEELTDERADLASEAVDDTNAVRDDAIKALADWDAADAEELAEELAELTKAATIDGELQTDSDAVRDYITNCALSVQTRSGWHDVGDQTTDKEFEILLSTGGPALRIMGELSEHGSPSRAWLEYQDWGTSWTQYFDIEQGTLLIFCQCFYFSE